MSPPKQVVATILHAPDATPAVESSDLVAQPDANPSPVTHLVAARRDPREIVAADQRALLQGGMFGSAAVSTLPALPMFT